MICTFYYFLDGFEKQKEQINERLGEEMEDSKMKGLNDSNSETQDDVENEMHLNISNTESSERQDDIISQARGKDLKL